MANPKGFSLIELLLVIAIMGLLTGLLLPNFSKIQTKAKETSLKSVATSLQQAIELYFVDNGTYPTGTNATVTALAAILEASGELTKIPQNPFTGKTYTSQDSSGKILYTYVSSDNHYTLQGFGDGQTVLFTLENM